MNKVKLGLATVATGTLVGGGALAVSLGTAKPAVTRQSTQRPIQGEKASFAPNTGIKVAHYATMDECLADLPNWQKQAPIRDWQCVVDDDTRWAEQGRPIVLEASSNTIQPPALQGSFGPQDSPTPQDSPDPQGSSQPQDQNG